MANLRTNNLSGEQGQNAYRGSVFFDGEEGSYLNLASGALISGTGFGTNDFTVEFWINQGVNASNYTNIISFYASTNTDRFQVAFHSSTIQVYTNTGSWADTGYAPTAGVYEHIAFVRNYSGNTLKMYANGEEKWSVSNNRDYDEVFETFIGDGPTSSYSAFQGYLSNLRVLNGTALYTTNYFTPPTSELTLIPNIVLLCCQDSDDPTQEATGKTITANGSTSLVNRTDNLIKNGRFTVSATENWTLSGGSAALGTGQSGSFNDGNHVVLTASSSYAYLYQAFTTVIGRTYRVNAQSNGADASFISTTTDENDYVISDIRSTTQTTDGRAAEKNFVATQTTYYVILRAGTGGGNFDTVSVYEEENRVPPKVIPPYGVDAGNTFGGPIQQSSQGYMYFPTGRTEERGRGRALLFVGYNPVAAGTVVSTVDFFSIQSQGNSTTFGSLSDTFTLGAAFSSSTRGIYAAGSKPAVGNMSNIDFFTIATTGNATDFGDIGTTFRYGAGLSNATRGIKAGGYQGGGSSGNLNIIEFVTIATTGNASDFGDTSSPTHGLGGLASPTRGVLGGGYPYPAASNIIEFITISTTGNTTDFGDLTEAKQLVAAGASNTRGIFGGGDNSGASKVINFITIATTGNAQNFGDLSVISEYAGMEMASNSSRMVFAGAGDYPAGSNTMEFINIATTGNAADFGDQTGDYGSSACSDSHGGLS